MTWRPDALGRALLLASQSDPHRPALVTDRGTCSVLDVADQSSRLAAELSRLGVMAGDRVIVSGERSDPAGFVAAYFAVHLVGAWCTPVRSDVLLKETRFLLEDTLPAAVVVAGDGVVSNANAGLFGENDEAVPLLMLESGDRARVATVVNGSLRSGKGARDDLVDPRGGDILYTTGTTGKPKGVVLPAEIQWETARRYADVQGLTVGSVIQSPIPLYTASAIMSLILPIVIGGSTLSVDTPFTPDESTRRLARSDSNVYKGVPAHFVLLKRAGVPPAPHVKTVITTAAPLSHLAFRAMHDVFPEARAISLFGSTESAGAFTAANGDELASDLAYLGSPCFDTTLDLISSEPSNYHGMPSKTGSLLLRSEVVADGYWRRPESVARSTFVSDGGVLTGDKAIRRGDRFFLGGRTSSVINRGGHKIDPSEIETVLARLPWVEDSCAVGTPDEVLGEDTLVMIQCAPSLHSRPDLLADEVTQAIATQLSAVKSPRWAVFVEELPRNPHGKADRRQILEELDRGTHSRHPLSARGVR